MLTVSFIRDDGEAFDYDCKVGDDGTVRIKDTATGRWFKNFAFHYSLSGDKKTVTVGVSINDDTITNTFELSDF